MTAKRLSEGRSCERSSFIPRSIPNKDSFESLSSPGGWEQFSFTPHTIDSATLTVACLHHAPRFFVPNSFLSAVFAGYSIRYISRSLRLILRSTHAVIDKDHLPDHFEHLYTLMDMCLLWTHLHFRSRPQLLIDATPDTKIPSQSNEKYYSSSDALLTCLSLHLPP